MGANCPRDWPLWWEDWGLGDFLEAFPSESFDEQGRPIDATRIYAFHAELADGSATVFRALRQFDDAEQAAAAVAWLQEQTEPRFRRIGWGDSVSIDQWRHKGETVYAEATVPDEDLPALVQGN